MVGLRAQRREVQDPESTVPRLEALAGRVLTGDIILPKFQWNIVYDLERQEFRQVTTFDEPPAHFMPTRLLADQRGNRGIQ